MVVRPYMSMVMGHTMPLMALQFHSKITVVATGCQLTNNAGIKHCHQSRLLLNNPLAICKSYGLILLLIKA